MSRFKEYMEIIQEMEENKGTDDMYTEFKKNLIIYLKQESLLIADKISDKIQKDLNEKKITSDKMNKEETKIKKLEEIFNSNEFKNDIQAIGKKLWFTEKATQDFFVKFINDMGLKKIYQQIDSQSTIDGFAQHQAEKFKYGMN
jgi:hypothetical protein